jgi:hypothetical protein
MGDYVIRMNLEVINRKNPEDNIGVIYDTDMNEQDAESIDAVEKIFINLNRQILKEGISEHLENISKKNAKNTRTQMEE